MTRTAQPAASSPQSRLGALFDTYYERLYRLALRLGADAEEARDLVQETFLRAARHPGRLPPVDSSAEAWLVRTLINLCRDRWRRLVVRRRSAAGERPPAPDPGPEDAVIARQVVHAALRTLSVRRRSVLVLHDIEELPVGEVATLLRLAKPTVRWHLAAARRDVAARLRTAGYWESTAKEPAT